MNQWWVENHWLDPGERRMKRVDVYDVYIILLSIKKKKPSYLVNLNKSRNIDSLSISLGDLSLRWSVAFHRHIYIFIVHCDRHVNKPESDGPTSNHYHHFLRPYGECDCVEERELLVGRSDVSFWFLFRIKSRQFNSPRPRRRTF